MPSRRSPVPIAVARIRKSSATSTRMAILLWMSALNG
jgi:hypothetical protein